MITTIRNSRYCKIVAVFIAMNLVFDIFTPLGVHALTGGPSQPEMEAFTPASTSDMVDLFTGDFHYNIPLLSVPGPNGGYPINLAYNAGITMEQEASWVGLGWNINPGSITRNMRGLPDDFKGDEIKKEYSMKPNWTIGVGLDDIDLEVFGIPVSEGVKKVASGNSTKFTVSGSIFYNSYKGFGLNLGMDIGMVKNTEKDALAGPLKGDLSISHGSQSGLSVSPSISMASKEKQIDDEYAGTTNITGRLGLSVNSRQGTVGLMMTGTNQTTTKTTNKKTEKPHEWQGGINFLSGPGTSFGTASYVPSVTMPLSTFSLNANVKLGPSAGAFANAKVAANYSRQATKKDPVLRPAYGLLYHESGNYASLLDFNREKDGAVNKHSKNLAIPVATYDVFSVSGQNTGGVFRLYRSDIPIFSDMAMYNSSADGEIGFDLGSIGVANHLGANLALSTSDSYSGMWTDGFGQLSFLKAENDQTSKSTYEPAFFKMTGELNESNLEQFRNIRSTAPAAFDMDIRNRTPHAKNSLNESAGIALANRTGREKRTQSIEYKTMSEKSIDPVEQQFLIGNSLKDYDYEAKPDHHIAEYTITNPDGSSYVYGLPAYNNLQREVMFSVAPKENHNVNSKFIAYDLEDASTANNKGDDQLFMATELPAYSHSYLLTQITGPDYVDVDGDGPSENDLGYWVKFNYTRIHENYQWRIPYIDANYSRGYESNKGDDRGSYTYGTKEIWYLSSVETKTHKAVFYLSDREDGLAAAKEHAKSKGSQKLKKIDSIDLLSKTNPNVPVKTVHFDYTYDLCGNVQNNSGIGVEKNGRNINEKKGKLTLKRVWFTYEKNQKGRFSPYVFDYYESITAHNPGYDLLKMDRWGFYSENNPVIRPYVNQNDEVVEQWMGVWNLKEIRIPSGAVIKVEYEADDYAYVQDKRAMQMIEIKGISNTKTNSGTNINLTHKELYVYLKSPYPVNSGIGINDYIGGLRDNLVYFRVFTEVMNGKKDYVEGYAEIEPEESEIIGNDIYIKLKLVDAGNIVNTNPIRLAAWQYLKMDRPDLLYPKLDNVLEFVKTVTVVFNLFKDMVRLFTGYYAYCKTLGYANEIILNDSNFPSFLRLNNPVMAKKGGGHRVQSISMIDSWSQPVKAEYNQEYFYKTFEGGREISSGVAEYEPMIGGEEIPLRYPKRYYEQKLFMAKNPELYLEEPFGESFFPGPNVGYSKVMVRAVTPGLMSADGIQLAEFYTAKDFPVIMPDITQETEVIPVKHKPFPVTIPTVGFSSYESYGYSQGYSIVLNNMHGKMKRMATYRPWQDMEISDLMNPSHNKQPVSKTEYFYKTDHPYAENAKNRLNNTVTVLHGDANTKQGDIGITYDCILDARENNIHVISQECLPNVDAMAVYPIFMLWPKLQEKTDVMRTLVFTKVTYQNGILMETRAYQEGALAATKNLMFDAETGEPLLTKVTSDFSDTLAYDVYTNPYYSYNMPAHWYYPQMRGKYINARAKYEHTESKKDTVSYRKGDAILATTNKYWLTGIDQSGHNVFKSSGGQTAQDLKGNIISGYTNQLAAPAAYIVSLTNPVAERRFPLFEGFNIPTSPPNEFQTYNNFKYKRFNFTDCFGEDVSSCAIYDRQNKKISFTLCPPFQTPGGGSTTTTYCEAILKLDSPIIPHQPWFSKMVLNIIDLNLDGIDDLYLETNSPNLVLITSESHTWENPNNCFCPETPLELDDLEWEVVNGKWEVTKIIEDYCGKDWIEINISYDPILGIFTFKLLSTTYTIHDPNEPNPCFPLDTLCDCEAWVELDAEVVNLPESPDGWELYKKGDKVEFVGANKTITGTWHDPENCHTECLDGVIRVGATEYSENWSYDYEDVKIQKPYPNNDYAGGRLGIYRPLRDNLYFTDRLQRKGDPTASNPQTNVQEDGTYDVFTLFNHETGNAVNQQKPWIWTTEITRYSPFGFDIENRNALGIYSSALYGYGNSLATAVTNNAAYWEIAFDGFEDIINPTTQNGHFNYGANIYTRLTNEESHTGEYSIKVSNGFDNPFKIEDIKVTGRPPTWSEVNELTLVKGTEQSFAPAMGISDDDKGKEYLFSGWIMNPSGRELIISIQNRKFPLALETPIDGWQRFEVVFTSPKVDFSIEIHAQVYYTPGNPSEPGVKPFYIDDIRLLPFNASMRTFVYDPAQHRTVAELDDNNYATFYNYDEEGTLVQVKKETERGIMTMRTTRQHITKYTE